MFDNLPPAHIQTTPVDSPYRVRLDGVPANEAVVWVQDEVIVDDHRIVRSAHSEGFWYVDNSSLAAEVVPLARFQSDRTVSFSCPQR